MTSKKRTSTIVYWRELVIFMRLSNNKICELSSEGFFETVKDAHVAAKRNLLTQFAPWNKVANYKKNKQLIIFYSIFERCVVLDQDSEVSGRVLSDRRANLKRPKKRDGRKTTR